MTYGPVTSGLPVIRPLSGFTSYADIGVLFETVDECEFEEMKNLWEMVFLSSRSCRGPLESNHGSSCLRVLMTDEG
jgi:hypothetical protein